MNFLRRLLIPRPTEAELITFGGCPYRAVDSTQGILLTGAPGSGKTVFKNQITDPILRDIASGRNETPFRRAFLYAHKPTEVLRHLHHIGIADEAMAIFHPGRPDCRPLADSTDFTGEDGVFELAKLLVPANPRASEPFWNDACATLLDAVGNTFRRFARGPWYSDDILYAVSDQGRLKWVLEHGEANRTVLDTFFSPDADRTRTGVLIGLENHARALRVSAKQLKTARKRGTGPFSFVRDWMGGQGPRIVVVCHAPTYAESWGKTYVPLIVSTAVRAFKEYTEHTRAVPALTLFDLDEFVQFRMSNPAEFFAIVRELGGVPLVAIQSAPLLHSVYGEDLGRGILSNLSLQAHGTTNDPETARDISAQFGEHELTRQSDSPTPQTFKEPRVPEGELLRENAVGKLRFYCRAPGIGKWLYEVNVRNLPPQRALPEDDSRVDEADFEPWNEEDMERLGLSTPRAEGRRSWPAFLNPNADWRTS